MAERRPIVLVGGVPAEIPAGDKLVAPSATAAGAGLNIGAAPANINGIAVSGDVWIRASDGSFQWKNGNQFYLALTALQSPIWQAGTKVTLAASVSANASFRIQHGAVPTSPLDGDMWTTTAGLFLRINGLVQTVPFLASVNLWGGKQVMPASTATSGAGLNIQPGAAPTSPVDGDVWSTADGFFGRAGGVTKRLDNEAGGGAAMREQTFLLFTSDNGSLAPGAWYASDAQTIRVFAFGRDQATNASVDYAIFSAATQGQTGVGSVSDGTSADVAVPAGSIVAFSTNAGLNDTFGYVFAHVRRIS